MASNHTVNDYSTVSFGPTEQKSFDFTPLFEDTLLSIVPSALLLFIIPARLFFLRKQARKVLRSALHSNKLVRLEQIYSKINLLTRKAFSCRVRLHANSPSYSSHHKSVSANSRHNCSFGSHSVGCPGAVPALPLRAHPVH